MSVNSVTSVIFKDFKTALPKNISTVKDDEPCELVSEFCKSFVLPDKNRNYSQFDENLAVKISSYKDKAVRPVTDMLKTAESERDITAGLLLLNRIYDAGAKTGTKKDWEIYPEISKFNYSKSPNVQVMLAGVYRKTQVPDAFGPLMTMFWDNAKQKITQPFDPNEEIGGAILEYLRNSSAVMNYSENTQKSS